MEGGAKINAPEQKSGNTALHLAVRENLFKVACILITEVGHTSSSVHLHQHVHHQSDIRVTSACYRSALLVFVLLQLKADINACTFGGNTPLHLAASLGSPTLCSMLIAAGGMH